MKYLFGGELEMTDVVEVVGSIFRDRLTGVLSLQRAHVRASIEISNGSIFSAQSTDPDDGLGPFMLKQGVISYDQLLEGERRALAEEAQVESILMEQRYVAQEDFDGCLSGQATMIVRRLLSWDNGHFSFEENRGHPVDNSLLRLPTPELLLQAVRGVRRWSRIARAVGLPTTLYQLQPQYERILDSISLLRREYALLALVRAERPLEEILRGSELDSVETCRLIWAFRVLGVVKSHYGVQHEAPLGAAPENAHHRRQSSAQPSHFYRAFCRQQAYLFDFLREEIGLGADFLLERAVQRLDQRLQDIFSAIQLDSGKDTVESLIGWATTVDHTLAREVLLGLLDGELQIVRQIVEPERLTQLKGVLREMGSNSAPLSPRE